MTYPTVQTALANVIKKLDDYSSANVNEDDHRQLADGVSKAVVLRRGNSGTADSGQQDFIGGGAFRYVRRDDWVVHVELWVPWTTDVLALRTSLTAEAQIILDHIDRWPALDGQAGLIDVGADIVPEPTEWIIADLRWFMQLIIVNVQEQSEVLVRETQSGQGLFRYGASNSLYGTAIYR